MAKEAIVKQVDVMGLMGALRTKGEAKLSDFAKPIESDNNNSINDPNSTIMANETKAADLIGKVIIVGENLATIEIKRVQDNGMLACEFKRGDAAPISMPVTIPNLEAQVKRGTWKFKDECLAPDSSPTGEVEVAEVVDITPKKPTIKPKAEDKPKAEKPKNTGKTKIVVAGVPKPGEVGDKPKAASEREESGAGSGSAECEQARPQGKGKLTYSTYTSKKGKTCARISGFGEDDPAYVNATEIHGSASWEKTKNGQRTNYIVFGHRYTEAARQVCEALNAGKSFEGCKAIVDGATAERQQKRQQKRLTPSPSPTGEGSEGAKGSGTGASKTYTLDEVAAKLRGLLPEGDKATAEDIRKLLEAA